MIVLCTNNELIVDIHLRRIFNVRLIYVSV